MRTVSSWLQNPCGLHIPVAVSASPRVPVSESQTAWAMQCNCKATCLCLGLHFARVCTYTEWVRKTLHEEDEQRYREKPEFFQIWPKLCLKKKKNSSQYQSRKCSTRTDKCPIHLVPHTSHSKMLKPQNPWNSSPAIVQYHLMKNCLS